MDGHHNLVVEYSRPSVIHGINCQTMHHGNHNHGHSRNRSRSHKRTLIIMVGANSRTTSIKGIVTGKETATGTSRTHLHKMTGGGTKVGGCEALMCSFLGVNRLYLAMFLLNQEPRPIKTKLYLTQTNSIQLPRHCRMGWLLMFQNRHQLQMSFFCLT